MENTRYKLGQFIAYGSNGENILFKRFTDMVKYFDIENSGLLYALETGCEIEHPLTHVKYTLDEMTKGKK